MLIVLDAAQKGGLRIATLFETTVAKPQHDQTRFPPDPDTVLAWLEDVVDLYAPHPAYLRVDGRPVVFAYAGQRLAESQWIDVLGRLRGTRRDIFLIGEGNNATRLADENLDVAVPGTMTRCLTQSSSSRRCARN